MKYQRQVCLLPGTDDAGKLLTALAQAQRRIGKLLTVIEHTTTHGKCWGGVELCQECENTLAAEHLRARVQELEVRRNA